MRGVSNFQYLGNHNPNDTTGIPSPGGKILPFTAGGTLLVGDVVQITAAFTVNKATTNPAKVIGVVVGGESMPDGRIIEYGSSTPATLIAAGLTAATVGQAVYVLVQGVAYVTADAAITNGAHIKMSTSVAGRVAPAVSAATIASGATAVTSSAANGAIISGDGFAGQIIGILIDTAAAANGDVRLAYINIF